MTKQSPLLFRVQCTACSGTEEWKLERIVRLLTLAGKMPPSLSKTDVEQIAELFIAHRGLILCPACGKTGVLSVQRLYQDGQG